MGRLDWVTNLVAVEADAMRSEKAAACWTSSKAPGCSVTFIRRGVLPGSQ